MALLWPWRLAYLAHRATRQIGPQVAQQTNKCLQSQFREQIRFGLQHGLSPLEYYRYGCYRQEDQPLIPQIILQHEVGPLVQRLNPDRHEMETQAVIIADKGRFAVYCAVHHLPTVPILAIVAGNARVPPIDAFAAQGPGCAFFVKPLRGARGQETQLWHDVGGGYYAQPSAESLPWPQVAAQLRARATQQALLIQPLLVNHPALADLAPGNLITIRLLTGRTPTGEIELLAATAKVALHADQISNTHGLNSPVHLDLGELGRAYTYRPLCPGFDYHPTTQVVITGRTLPAWPQTVALARAAHVHLPHFVFLGWDIALTPDGPMLLEGNAGWETLMVQKPQQRPLGQTRFRDICLQWIEKQR